MSEWISVKDVLPVDGKYVLLFDGKNVIRGQWIPKFFDDNCDDDGDNYEYRESDDSYWVPEGWYEAVKYWDMYSSVKIGSEITHWMLLPEPPKKG